MPTIQSVLKVQIDGGQAKPLVKTTSVQVDLLEQFNLFVDAVPAPKAVKTSARGRPAGNKKAAKRLNKVTYKLSFSNVKFAAIYNAGQGSGLRVKVGNSKNIALTEPLIFAEKDTAVFRSSPTITLENDSNMPRSAVMLIGSDLPKDARHIELVQMDSNKSKPRGKSK